MNNMQEKAAGILTPHPKQAEANCFGGVSPPSPNRGIERERKTGKTRG